MLLFIETKFTLEITPCHYCPSIYRGTITKLYSITLRDQRSKKELAHRLVHSDEILSHVEEILPLYSQQIQNQIKSEFKLI
jgi:uncharacterized lipoprotein YajG